MALTKWTSTAATLALLIGCAEQQNDVGDLELNLTDSSVSGTYTAAGGEVLVYESVQVAEGVIEIAIDVNGMSLVATIDRSGAADIDGYSADGRDTQMTEADRLVIDAFAKAIYDAEPNTQFAPMATLERFASLWGSYPDTVELTRLILAQENRSYYSLCAYVGWYVLATHDGPGSWVGGCSRDNWDDSSTYYGYLSAHGAQCGGDGTTFWNGSRWACYEPDHSNAEEYAYGLCFGQCGEGCGSPDYTIDCLDHDSCVRFGHATVSISCQDEFNSTLDDWGFAPVC